MPLGGPILAHVAGIPVEETLLYAVPVATLCAGAVAAQLTRAWRTLRLPRRRAARPAAPTVSAASESPAEGRWPDLASRPAASSK
jgi:hypothetical protein